VTRWAKSGRRNEPFQGSPELLVQGERVPSVSRYTYVTPKTYRLAEGTQTMLFSGDNRIHCK
jgi:hypothetical protein